MKPLAHVVAATDLSEGAEKAVRRAVMLASEHGVGLDVLHVIPRGGIEELGWAGSATRLRQGFRRIAREDLEALAASLGAAVEISTQVEMGDVVQRITAQSGGDTLVVVGARGQGFFRDLLLGSTAERLLGRARGPVLVVKAPSAGPYRNVVAGLDLRQGSERVLDAALRVAPGAGATAVHAYDVPFEGMLLRAGIEPDMVERHRGEAMRDALHSLDAIVRRAGSEGRRIVAVTERSHPARLLLEHPAAREADLIVLGRRPRSAAERLLVGSVARHVIAGADRDVLLVPQEHP